MPRKANSYGPGISKRHRTFYVSLEIPKELRHRFGKPRFICSLKTDDLRRARQAAPIWLERWKAEIAEARNETDDAAYYRHNIQRAIAAGDPAQEQALREAVAERFGELSHPTYTGNVLRDAGAEQVAWEMADDFADRATGLKTPLLDHVDQWLEQAGVAPRTAGMMRTDVERLAVSCPTVQEVTPKRANSYIALRLHQVSPATVRKTLNSLRGYWRYLQHIDVAPETVNPFDDMRVMKLKRNGQRGPKRRHFTPEDVRKLIDAADGTLKDLITLAAYTGCRIEELCSLKIEDVHADYFNIVSGKTEDAVREVPIHPAIRQTVARLLDESADGYLLSGLTVNSAGQRSNSIGHDFSKLKKRLGFDSSLVFHSIRKTVAILLEGAQVPEVVSARILGHKLRTMTYGVYSGGVPLKVKAEALGKVSYK